MPLDNKPHVTRNLNILFQYHVTGNNYYYLANIRPIMEYADSVCAGGNAIDLYCLDMVQKDAARVVT